MAIGPVSRQSDSVVQKQRIEALNLDRNALLLLLLLLYYYYKKLCTWRGGVLTCSGKCD